MGWHDEIEAILKRYMSEPAADAALTLFSSFYTTERVCTGKVDEEAKRGMLRMLVGLTFGLPNNEFWKRHAAFVMPVYAVAVMAWMDSMKYYSAGKEKAAEALMTRAVIMETATAVLMMDLGVPKAREVSAKLRDELAAVKME